MNRLMGAFNSFGLSVYGVRIGRITTRKKGIAYARENVAEKKYYLGKEGRSELNLEVEVDRITIGILLEILQVGLGISVSVIIFEIVFYFFYERSKSVQIIDIGSVHRLTYAPQIYVEEFRIRAGTSSLAAVRFLNARSHCKSYPL